MERTGEVTAVNGRELTITFCRPSDCEKCHGCLGASKTHTITLEGDAAVGDYAVVSIPDDVIMKASVITYALPFLGLLLGLILGTALFPDSEGMSALLSVLGLLIPVVLIALTESRRRRNPTWSPQLIRVIRAGNH